jgi:hydrogenase expression/formation protein HypC
MCLAIPVQVVDRDGDCGLVEVEGVRRQVSLLFVPEAEPGDYVLLHAGFAIQRLDEGEAVANLRLIGEMAEADRSWNEGPDALPH